MTSYAARAAVGLIEYKIFFIGRSKIPVEETKFNRDTPVSAMEDTAKTAVNTKMSLPKHTLKAQVEATTTEVLVTIQDDNIFYCPSCEKLREELEQSKKNALIRQAALNIEMHLKESSLNFIDISTVSKFQSEEFGDDGSSKLCLNRGKLYHYSLNDLLSELRNCGRLSEYFDNIGVKDMGELNRLRRSLKEMKELFNTEAHPTKSVSDPNRGLSYEECSHLIDNCPQISDKNMVLLFVNKVRDSRSPEDDFLQSFLNVL